MKAQKKKKRFKVGLSFPGDRRPCVGAVAGELAAQFGWPRVLYDEYHRAEFARFNLDTHLPNLYRDECELIVVFLCQDYKEKEWCGLEWRAIRQLIKDKSCPDERIMPIKLDDVEISKFEGLHSVDGYLDGRNLLASELTVEILRRVALRDSAGLTSDSVVARIIEYLRGGAHSFDRIRKECLAKTDSEPGQIAKWYPLAFEEVPVKSGGKKLPGMRLTKDAKTKLGLEPLEEREGLEPHSQETAVVPANIPLSDPVDKALASDSLDVLATLFALTLAERSKRVPINIGQMCKSTPLNYYGFKGTAAALRDVGVASCAFSRGTCVNIEVPNKIKEGIETRFLAFINSVKNRKVKPRDHSDYYQQIKAYFEGPQ